MALWFPSRTDLRRAILVMLAAAAALPMASRAVPAPPVEKAPAEKAYAAFFLGQGGYVFSWGIPLLAWEARKMGFATDVFSYNDVTAAWTNIVRMRNDGYRIALVGYSLGNTTATYLQRHLPVDLLLAISESSFGRNHPVKKENTRRSVLWYGPDTLSNAGIYDGFDDINYINRSHLLMDLDSRVVRGVLDELKSLLVTPERRDEQVVAANVPLPAPRPAAAPTDELVPAQTSAGWLPPVNVITPDVTCSACWGFTPSLGAAEHDPWMQSE
jgi:hypothetical protein